MTQESYEEDLKKRILANRVFILGAGFSADAGVPLTDKLLPLAMDMFRSESRGLFDRVNGYAKELLSIDGEPDYSQINFSQFCTFLEFQELREHAGGERWSDSGSREKLALRYYLAKCIVENTPNPDSLPKLYLEFAMTLHPGDIVVSFNWDCLLELALGQLEKAYSYGFESEKIWLCKLHGSVNWRINLPHEVTRLGWKSIGLSNELQPYEAYTAPSPLLKRTWRDFAVLSELEPFIVLPGHGKSSDVRKIATLWYKPEWAFAFTHHVYIIGLSLSDDDYFIRSFFLSNLPYIHGYSGVEGRKILIVNPDSCTKMNYDFILKLNSTKWIQEKFSLAHVQMITNNSL